MSRRTTPSRLTRLVTLVAVTAGVLGGLPVLSSQAATDRIDLRVLLVSNGGSNVEALRAELAAEGVPTTVVDLADSSRPIITPTFLADSVSTGDRAKFQSVVLPNDGGGGLGVAELAALAAYEQRFGIRQVDAYTYPTASLGLGEPSYAGPLDGKAASVTAAGLQSPFQYLRGAFSVDDANPAVNETYGYLAEPVSANFTPLVVIGGSPVVGAYADSGREQLVITGAFNADQTWFRLLAHGLVTWMTKGVHLGYDRHYFAVQVDDVLLPDARWSTAGRCTPGSDCPAGVPATPNIRMTSADVAYLVRWQQVQGFQVDLAFNAAGSVDEVAATGSDPLTSALLARKSRFRWLNHTYGHQFLGCLQDFSIVPWRCQTDSAGKTLYLPQADIAAEISRNVAWAKQHHVSLQRSELVTGEHSGLAVSPQQPADNPNLAAALADNGISSIASDASREATQRAVGRALTVPRHPMNVFYNAATTTEEVDEYNWIYNSIADGGSGLCVRPGSTCIAPLPQATGFADSIVPLETRIAMGHVLGNDPRPHYVHQSNFTEGRIAYPVLDGVLSSYRSWFAASAALQTLRLDQQRTVLERAANWRAANAAAVVTAYTLGGTLFVTSSKQDRSQVPVTVPQRVAFGTDYAGERSDYVRIGARTQFVLPL